MGTPGPRAVEHLSRAVHGRRRESFLRLSSRHSTAGSKAEFSAELWIYPAEIISIFLCYGGGNVKIRIVSIGKVRQSFVKEGEAEFIRRLPSGCHLEFQEIDCDKFSKHSEDEIKKKEAQELLKKVDANAWLVVLEGSGKQLSSEQFAGFIRERQNSGSAELVFAIGGVYGWDKSVLQKARFNLSLSNMTFTHQMTRLFLVEQIYRAFSINEGLPYHK